MMVINRDNRDSGGVEWPMGLDNLGNTCFMNSALQCLSRTRSLLDKLDLYGNRNVIEILVSPDDPSVQIMNPNVDTSFDSNCENEDSTFMSSNEQTLLIHHQGGGGDSLTQEPSAESSSGEISPSTTEIDSLLDAASSRSSRSSKSEGIEDAEKEMWKKELDQELAKPLRLRLNIPRESMTTKARHCFKAITRSSDVSSDADGGGGSSNNSYGYSRNVYSPRNIQMAVSKHFRLGHQHDSHELLRTVVDMMKKDQIRSFRVGIMTRYGVNRNDTKNCDPKLTELLKMWDRKLYHKTFVDEIFGGELVTFQECLQCRNVRRSHEEFLDLSLPIRVFRANNPNPTTVVKKTYSYSLFDDNDYVINRSVEECLRAYTEPEFLTGSNVVECEKCHRLNLEKLANGAPFDEVFPNVNIDSSNSQGNSKKPVKMSKSQQKKQNKSTKRQTRREKLKAKYQSAPADTNHQPQDSNCASNNTTEDLTLVEDHFTNEQQQQQERNKSLPEINTVDVAGACGGVEDDSKSSKSGSLDDYVVVQNATTINHASKKHTPQKKYTNNEIVDPLEESDPQLVDGENYHYHQLEEDESDLLEEPNLARGLSSSIKSLTLIENGMDIEEEFSTHQQPGGGEDDLLLDDDQNMMDQNLLDEYMDDLDEPAVDGIGNASDIEDDEDEYDRRNNGPCPLDLGLEDKPISVADYLSVPALGSGGTADEGFSEGENSSEEKPSQSLSGASSHNSISEADNITDRNIENNKTTKKIPVTKCPCSRRQLISRAPECLTLHLKRFQHTARGSSKLGDKVSFPYILNLTEFCSEVDEDVNRPGFKSTFDEDGEVVYSLYGIVEHSGSLHFGHYVAYVKVASKPSTDSTTESINSNNSNNNNNTNNQSDDSWFYISDSHVSRTTLKQVLVQDAYILFYERIRGPEKKKRLEQQQQESERRDSWNQQRSSSCSTTVTYSYADNNKPISTTTSITKATTNTINTAVLVPSNTIASSSSTSWVVENWEKDDASSEQVSSTNEGGNNEDMSITLTYESSADTVSSSTLYSSSTVPLLTGIVVDSGVSSTTDADSMDFSNTPTTEIDPETDSSAVASSSHPVWSYQQMHSSDAIFVEDEGETPTNTNNNPVSSSSDIIINPRSTDEVD